MGREQGPEIESEDRLPIWRARDVDFADRLRLGWRQELAQHTQFPAKCTESVVQALLDLDTQGALCTAVSWVELAFILHLGGFQFWHRPNGSWQPVGKTIHEPRPNLSAVIFFLRRVIHWLLGHFGMSDCLVSGLDVSHLGVCLSQGGILLGIDSEVLQRAHEAVSNFVRKPMRKAADFARPLT